MKQFASLLIAFLFPFTMVLSQEAEPVKVEDNPNAPEISFENTVHDYGIIAYGGDGTCYFKFTNSGKEPLILQKPQSSSDHPRRVHGRPHLPWR